VEANLVELDDQIFEVKKSLEELSADYQDAIIDETARHTVFENAKIAELVSVPPPPIWYQICASPSFVCKTETSQAGAHQIRKENRKVQMPQGDVSN